MNVLNVSTVHVLFTYAQFSGLLEYWFKQKDALLYANVLLARRNDSQEPENNTRFLIRYILLICRKKTKYQQNTNIQAIK